MGKFKLHRVSLWLMWIGAVLIALSFLMKLLVRLTIPGTPFFFLMLLMGILMYTVARIL